MARKKEEIKFNTKEVKEEVNVKDTKKTRAKKSDNKNMDTDIPVTQSNEDINKGKLISVLVDDYFDEDIVVVDGQINADVVIGFLKEINEEIFYLKGIVEALAKDLMDVEDNEVVFIKSTKKQKKDKKKKEKKKDKKKSKDKKKKDKKKKNSI